MSDRHSQREFRRMVANDSDVDFSSELAAVMYAFGDKKEQLPESLELMNLLVLEYMQGMTKVAMANTFNGVLSHESLQFAIRKDQRKTDRVKHLLRMFDEVSRERDLQLKKNDVDSSSKSGSGQKRKAASSDSAKVKRVKAVQPKKQEKAPKNLVSKGLEQLLPSSQKKKDE